MYLIDDSQAKLRISTPSIRQSRGVRNVQVHWKMVHVVSFRKNQHSPVPTPKQRNKQILKDVFGCTASGNQYKISAYPFCTAFRTWLCNERILHPADFCFHSKEESCISTPPTWKLKSNISRKIQFNFFFPFLQEKCVTPNNRTVESTEKSEHFSSLPQNPLVAQMYP